MAILKSAVFDGALIRVLNQGDVLAAGEIINPLVTVGSGVLTAALLLGGIINRTGSVGAYADTTDSAANIINGMIANYPYVAPNTGISSGAAVMSGTTVRLRFINTVAFADTIAAGTGVTLVNPVVNASSVKDFLLTVTNGTPTQVFAGNQTNASAVITGMSQFQTSQLSVGMLVTGTNIQAASTIASIQVGVGVTLSLPVTATLALNTLTFSPTVTLTGLGQGLL